MRFLDNQFGRWYRTRSKTQPVPDVGKSPILLLVDLLLYKYIVYVDG